MHNVLKEAGHAFVSLRGEVTHFSSGQVSPWIYTHQNKLRINQYLCIESHTELCLPISQFKFNFDQ